MATQTPSSAPFFGWHVVAAAFVVALFGWGLGFYGPPVYLHAVREARGWPVTLVSTAVTVHYLCGALVVANLPFLFSRFGLPAVMRGGSVMLALGLSGWALAAAPWHLFAATVLTGCGWVTMGAAAINAIVAPWFNQQRPRALSTAYNGASVGGILFTPLWSLLIGAVGFPLAALLIGLPMVGVIWWLTFRVLAVSPADLHQQPDGLAAAPVNAAASADAVAALPGHALWKDWHFRTLAAGMALGLFAQIGLLAHLFSLIVPLFGASGAGFVAGLATASAIVGRTAFGWLMPADGNRRDIAALSYGIQIIGVGVLMASGLNSPVPVVLGVILFGFGIGNATSLPPLIAQKEFSRADAARVVPLIVAIGQASYAMAPLIFGLVRSATEGGSAAQGLSGTGVFILAMAIKGLAIGALVLKRRPRSS